MPAHTVFLSDLRVLRILSPEGDMFPVRREGNQKLKLFKNLSVALSWIFVISQ